jgi:hypothetical protein
MNATIISIAVRFVSFSSSALGDELREIRNCWFHLLLACTAIVLVGVFMEESDKWLPEGRPILIASKGTFVSSPWIKWKKEIAHLGWILILFGVWGEFAFEALVSNADETLQAFNGNLLEITRGQAGDAANSANRASGAAAQAVRDETKIASDLDIEGKRERVAEQELETEKKTRLRLAASLLPRDFEQTSVVDAVKTFPPRKVVFEFSDEKEARQLAEEIAYVFVIANARGKPGWSFVRRQVEQDTIWEGVHIMQGWAPQPKPPLTVPFNELRIETELFNSRQSTGKALAEALSNALTEFEIDSAPTPDIFATSDPQNDGITADTLLIRIGPKPDRVLVETIRELAPLKISRRAGSVAFGNLAIIPNEKPPSKQ